MVFHLDVSLWKLPKKTISLRRREPGDSEDRKLVELAPRCWREQVGTREWHALIPNPKQPGSLNISKFCAVPGPRVPYNFHVRFRRCNVVRHSCEAPPPQEILEHLRRLQKEKTLPWEPTTIIFRGYNPYFRDEYLHFSWFWVQG